MPYLFGHLILYAKKPRSLVPLFLILYIVDDLSILFDYLKYQIKAGNRRSLPGKVNSSRVNAYNISHLGITFPPPAATPNPKPEHSEDDPL